LQPDGAERLACESHRQQHVLLRPAALIPAPGQTDLRLAALIFGCQRLQLLSDRFFQGALKQAIKLVDGPAGFAPEIEHCDLHAQMPCGGRVDPGGPPGFLTFPGGRRVTLFSKV
jgi:hypothetical protein